MSYGDSMKFKRERSELWQLVERKSPLGVNEKASTSTSPSGSGCVSERVGRRESSRGGCVGWCNPGLCESKEVKGLQGCKARYELSLASGRLAVPQATCNKVLCVCGTGGIGKSGGVAEILRANAWFVVSPRGHADRNGEAAHFRIKSPSNVGRI